MMFSHSIPTDNGKYDFVLTITLEGCTVEIQENEGNDGRGATVFQETHSFEAETEAQAFYLAAIRKHDPDYFPPASFPSSSNASTPPSPN